MELTLNHFNFNDWLPITLPVEPYSDLNEKMSPLQMSTYKEKLENLRDALIEAGREELEEDACQLLKKQFGDDFPVPEKKDAAKAAAVAGFAPSGVNA